MRHSGRTLAVVGAGCAVAATAIEALQFQLHQGWITWLWLIAVTVGLAIMARGLNRLQLDLGTRALGAVIAGAVVAVIVLPFLFVVVMGSFESRIELLAGPHLIPTRFTVSFFPELFSGTTVFRQAFQDSLLVGITVAVVTTLSGLLGAYAIARIRFPGRSVLYTSVMIVYMLPGIILIVPLVGILKRVQLVDTLAGMIVGHSALILPFVVWLMVGAFNAIDPDLEHAARLDGCTRIAALRRVVGPLILPSLATTAVFAFVLSWNDLLFAKVMYISQTPMLAPTIVNFMDPITRVEPQLSAAGLVSSVPVLLLALLMQRYIIRGIAEGSVK